MANLAKTNEKENQILLSSNIQVNFKFLNEDFNRDLSNLLSEIRNLDLTILDTKTGKYHKGFTIFFYVNEEKTSQIPLEKYTDLKKKYSKVLDCIEITNDMYLGSHAEYQNKRDLKEIEIDDIEDILNIFLKSIDAIQLEIILTNSILGSADGFMSEKDMGYYELDNRFAAFKKLVIKDETLYNRDIKRIFLLIEDADFLIKKLIFSYILRKDTYKKLDDLIKNYKRVKGKNPFTDKELEDIRYIIRDNHISKLEFFFRNYIGVKGIKEDLKSRYDFNTDKLKVQIPLNPNAYDFNTQYNDEVSSELRYAFRNKVDLVLETFRRVILYECKRVLNLDISAELLVSFDYDNSKDTLNNLKADGIYYEDLNKLLEEKSDISLKYDVALDNNVEYRRSFVIFKGYSQESKRKTKTEIRWERTFQIRDHFRNTDFCCKILRNKAHFKNLVLNMESEIEIQAFFIVKFKYIKTNATWHIVDKYFEIVDIQVLDKFKTIEITIGKHFNGISKLENTRDGLILYKYPKNQKVYFTKYLDVPIILLNIYKGQNSLFYEVKLDGEVIVKEKNDLANYIEHETTLNYISGSKLKESISMVLNAYRKEHNMLLKSMFNTIGLFEDGDSDIVLSHPENDQIAVIGENDIQTDVIENVKNLGLDHKGKLAKNFFKILHIKTQKLNFRLGVFGYSSIHPFFYFLKKYLDVFPNLFAIGIHGSGKTTLLEIMINDMYGTKMKSPDTIDSVARLTKYSTESTFALNVDDIDILDEKLMNWIKTNSTRKGTRDRLTKDNKKISEQTYASYSGSANSKDFLAGSKNDAFRKRCFIFELMEKIDMKEETDLFEEQKSIIKDNEVFGFYLLEKSIDYIKRLYPNKKLNFHQKLVKLIKEKKREFKKLFIKNNVNLCDIRRLTMYSLIYIGWELWDNVFKEKGLKSAVLRSALDLDSGVFVSFVRELEDAEYNISLEIIDNILEFYIGRIGKFGNIETKDGDIVLQRDFVNDYDEFAKRRGYDTLGSLTRLGDIQSELLNRHIKPGTIYFKKAKDNDFSFVSEYGIIFYFKEIQELRNDTKGIAELEKIEETQNEYEETGKIDMDRIFKSGTFIERFERLFDRTKEILEENGNKPIEMKSIIQALELMDGISGNEVDHFIKTCLFEEILRLKDGFIYLKNK